MVKIDMDAIRHLSVAERVQLVQAIWDTLQPTAEDLPLTDDQRGILEGRLAEHQADPASAVPWETVREVLSELPRSALAARRATGGVRNGVPLLEAIHGEGIATGQIVDRLNGES